MVIKEHICEFKIHNNNDVLKFIGFIKKSNIKICSYLFKISFEPSHSISKHR